MVGEQPLIDSQETVKSVVGPTQRWSLAMVHCCCLRSGSSCARAERLRHECCKQLTSVTGIEVQQLQNSLPLLILERGRP